MARIEVEVLGRVVAVDIGRAPGKGAGGGAGRAVAALDGELEVARLTGVEAEALDIEDAHLGIVVLSPGRGPLLVDLERAIVGLGHGQPRHGHDEQGQKGQCHTKVPCANPAKRSRTHTRTSLLRFVDRRCFLTVAWINRRFPPI